MTKRSAQSRPLTVDFNSEKRTPKLMARAANAIACRRRYAPSIDALIKAAPIADGRADAECWAAEDARDDAAGFTDVRRRVSTAFAEKSWQDLSKHRR